MTELRTNAGRALAGLAMEAMGGSFVGVSPDAIRERILAIEAEATRGTYTVPITDETWKLTRAHPDGYSEPPEPRASPATGEGLDDAWKAAEAELPEGWVFECGTHGDGRYWAQALAPEIGSIHPYVGVVHEPTPTAALLALAARLAATTLDLHPEE